MSLLKSTGNPDIDHVHEKMINMMKNIIKETENGSTVDQLKFQLADLYSAAEVHFREEEILMHDINYPFSPVHIMAHEDILSKIRAFLEILIHSKKDYNILVNTLLNAIEKHVECYDIALFTYNKEINLAGMVSNG